MSVSSDPTFAAGVEIAGHLVLSTVAGDGSRTRLRARDGQGRGDEVALQVTAGADATDVTDARRRVQRQAGLGHPAWSVPTDICLTEHGLVTVRPWFDTMLDNGARAAGLSSRQTIELIRLLAETLAAAHDRGFRHGAVHGPNVAIDADGCGRLVDAAAGPATEADDSESLGRLGTGWLGEYPASPGLELALDRCRATAEGRIDAADLAEGLAQLVEATDAATIAGRRPVPPPIADRARLPSRLACFVAVGALVVAAGATRWLVPSPDGGPTHQPTAATLVDEICAASDDAATPIGAELVWGDLAGSGCRSAAIWWPTRAEVEILEGPVVGRFRLGERGDALVLGDWDGDGAAEPALYRPATGEVFTWSGWPVDGDIAPSTATRDSGIVGGRPVVVESGDHQAVEVVEGTPS